MATSSSDKGKQIASASTASKAADKGRSSSSNSGDMQSPTGHKAESGLLSRVADSASRLARGATSSRSLGTAAFDANALSEAKAQRQEGSSPLSQEWVADSRHAQASTSALALAENGLPAASASASAASAFRLAARAPANHSSKTPAEAAAASASSNMVDSLTNSHSTGVHTNAGGKDKAREQATHQEPAVAESHQMRLAQDLDGRGVLEFLSKSQPTSMSISHVGRSQSHLKRPARQRGPHVAGTVETTDPIAYLQGATYAMDMESLDHQVPQSVKEAKGSRGPSASPTGDSRSWDEHGASILEEWELNEAWDRAWMSTAWSSAKKKAEETPKVEQVLPSNKNLSYLLKPRM